MLKIVLRVTVVIHTYETFAVSALSTSLSTTPEEERDVLLLNSIGVEGLGGDGVYCFEDGGFCLDELWRLMLFVAAFLYILLFFLWILCAYVLCCPCKNGGKIWEKKQKCSSHTNTRHSK